MPNFSIDNSKKVPIYLQLKDQIKYFIATGSLSSHEQLPPVKAMARSLSINFLTVRKAYKELEAEGLVQIKHGEGTFVALSPETRPHTIGTAPQNSRGIRNDLLRALEIEISRYESLGLKSEEVADCVEDLLKIVRQRASRPTVVFTECNQFQIMEISELLKAELNMDVIAVMTDKLEGTLSDLVESGRRTIVVTTGFHVTEVRDAVGDMPIEVNVLITNLNPKTRRHLESIGQRGKFSFICRDRESTIMYKDLLKAELGFEEIDLTSCTIYETMKVQEALRNSDAVLASPPVYDSVKKMAPKDVKVYNLFERVDPMSLKVIKDRILSSRV